MKFKLYFTLIIFSTLFGKIIAEEEPLFQLHQYAQKQWRSVSGLAHDNVTSIYKDKTGFLWAGTIEGLSRIDGSSSKTFSTRTHPQILSNRIVAIDGFDENLFVATARGISKFSENRFEKVIEETGIMGMTVTATGEIYVSKGTEILYIYDSKTTRLSVVNGLPEGTVLSIDSNKEALFFGTGSSGIFSYSKGVFSKNMCEFNKLPVTAVLALEDKVIFGNSEGKIFEIKDSKCSALTADIFKQKETGEVKAISGSGTSIRAITQNYLIFIEGSKSRYVPNCCSIPGIPSSILFDDENRMWISGNKGLSLFYSGTFVTLGKDEGLSSEMVYAMVEDNDGRVWVGSRGGGLFYYTDGIFKQVPEKAGIKSPFIGGLLVDDKGNIWAGTSKGIVTFSPRNPTKIKEVQTSKQGSTPLASVIFQDSRKRIWAGTATGAIYLFVNDAFSFIRQIGTGGEDYISAITEDNKGNLWFATSSGLIIFDKDSFKTISLKEGLSDNPVLSVFPDKSGYIFAGMMRTGLSVILPDGKIVSVGTKNGLCSDTVYSMILDSKDSLWFTSTHGIFSIKRENIIDVATGKKENLTCRQFDSQDGIKRPENTGGVQPSSMIRKNGELWFPTVEGIAAIRSATRSESAPHVMIDDILIDGKNIKISDSFKVKGDASLFEIKYTASRFIHPEKLKIRYKLDPYDSDWIDSTGSKTANYQKVPSGKYSFIVEAVDENGNTQTKSVNMEIENNSVFNRLPVKLILLTFFVTMLTGFYFIIMSRRKGKEKKQINVLQKEEEIQPVNIVVAVPIEQEPVEQFSAFDESIDEDDVPKYEKSRLDEEIAKAYATELKDLMEKQKLYKNPELTLPELAKKLNLSTNILSQVINGYCKLNFYTFVNVYRTEAVVEMMKDQFYKDRSILDLAYDAGFKSKTTFNAIFKKHTGLTPSEFRKTLSENHQNQQKTEKS